MSIRLILINRGFPRGYTKEEWIVWRWWGHGGTSSTKRRWNNSGYRKLKKRREKKSSNTSQTSKIQQIPRTTNTVVTTLPTNPLPYLFQPRWDSETFWWHHPKAIPGNTFNFEHTCNINIKPEQPIYNPPQNHAFLQFFGGGIPGAPVDSHDRAAFLAVPGGTSFTSGDRRGLEGPDACFKRAVCTWQWVTDLGKAGFYSQKILSLKPPCGGF